MKTSNSLHCHIGSLSDKAVFDFIAKGLVQSIQSNKTYEIEAKLKTFTAKTPQKIGYSEFNNAQTMLIRQLSSNPTFEERSFFLLSFGFKDGFRLTFDAHTQEFILEIKDKNNEKNTLSIQQNGVNMNLSKKQETLVDDELILKEYIRKLTEGEFENVRIKVRKTYTTEHIERCFSKVIQLSNTPGAYRSYGFNKHPLETLLGKVKQFTITKKQKIGLQMFTFLYKQPYEQYVAYEIEVEVIDVKHYFEDLVKKKNKQLLTQKIHDFNQSIEQIISNINAPLPLINKILGEYADKVNDSTQI